MKNGFKKSALAFALISACGVANAAGLSITPASVTTSTVNVPPVTVQFTGDGTVAFFEAEVTFDSSIFTATVAAQNGMNCGVHGTQPGVIVVSHVDPNLQPMGDAAACEITLTVTDPSSIPGAGSPDVTYPLAFQNDLWGDSNQQPVGGNTVTGGEVVLSGTGGGTPPAGADAAFNPAAGGTVTFPGGASGAATQGSITMTVTGGNAGDQATLNNCALSGADATDFILATPMPLNVSTGGNGQIEVTSTVGAAARTATLTCELTDSNDAATPVSWTLNVPAAGGGGTPGNPMYSSNPAPGATISATGDAGMTVMRNVVITNTGGDGLEYTCTVTGTAFAIASGGSGANIAANGTATVALQFTFPAAGATETGTLECTHNATGSPVSYPLSATGRAAGRATPTMVPASSLWSQIAMFGLFGALGMLVLGLRRGR